MAFAERLEEVAARDRYGLAEERTETLVREGFEAADELVRLVR